MTTHDNFQLKTPLDQTLFKKFLSDEMTVKETKAFQVNVSQRFSYIVHQIAELTGRTVDWFDYSNEAGEGSPGVFDTELYFQHVDYTGHIYPKHSQERFERYDYSFPTFWFYTDFESQLTAEKDKFFKQKEEHDEKIRQEKNHRQDELLKIQQRIKNKLTTEELAYISFLSYGEIAQNKEKIQREHQAMMGKSIKKLKQKGIDVSAEYKKYRESKKRPQNFNLWVARYLEQVD